MMISLLFFTIKIPNPSTNGLPKLLTSVMHPESKTKEGCLSLGR